MKKLLQANGPWLTTSHGPFNVFMLTLVKTESPILDEPRFLSINLIVDLILKNKLYICRRFEYKKTIMMEQLRQLSKKEVILAFAASCVESVARATSMSYYEVFRRMKKLDLFEKLIFPHYDVLHTESREVVTQRLVEIIESK